jgi:hypothetical protein
MRDLFVCCCILLCLSQPANARKEYPSLLSYKADHPLGKYDGTDGNWLTKDRKKATTIWDVANEKNLKSAHGFQEYQSLYERADFYKWFHHKTKSLGFTTQWTKLATVTTYRLSHLLSPVPRLLGYSNPEIQEFINKGNKLIFDDCWMELSKLRYGETLTGTLGQRWDEKILTREQELIHPYYLKLKQGSITKLERLLKKESFPTRFFSGCEFQGSLLSISDVCAYGLRRMGY